MAATRGSRALACLAALAASAGLLTRCAPTAFVSGLASRPTLDVGARDAGLVALRSQGQGGRFTLGQVFMPQVKGAKKSAVFRKRKNYGTHGARKVPRRYPIYDLLEELDETTPTYTVVSEPDMPEAPVEDVPLTARYPWAGSLDKVPQAKQDMEESYPSKMEPYFGSWTRQNLPPMGRRQRYEERRGVPSYNYPPWINRPLIGEGIRKVSGSYPYLKDRRPKFWQLTRAQQAKIREQEDTMGGAMDEVMADMDDDLDDIM